MKVFTYGSLMFPEVWRRVAGAAQVGIPARLSGYEARCLAGQTYPALVESAHSLTEGVLYQEVNAVSLRALDAFEGGFYRRREVFVTAGGLEIPAWVYAAADSRHPDILPEKWCAEDFSARHLTGFLRHDPGFSGTR